MHRAYFIGGGPLDGATAMVREEEPVIRVPLPSEDDNDIFTYGPLKSGNYYLIACDHRRMRSVYEWAG